MTLLLGISVFHSKYFLRCLFSLLDTIFKISCRPLEPYKLRFSKWGVGGSAFRIHQHTAPQKGSASIIHQPKSTYFLSLTKYISMKFYNISHIHIPPFFSYMSLPSFSWDPLHTFMINVIYMSALHMYEQKYSRLRCLSRVKGLAICFYLGWPCNILQIRTNTSKVNS